MHRNPDPRTLSFAPEAVRPPNPFQEVFRSSPAYANIASEHAFNPQEREGAIMVAELSFIEDWIPEQMEPGTLFMLENAGDMGEARNPYWAVLACPGCGALGLITRAQYGGVEAMICGADDCSCEYVLRDGVIGYRKPH